jgi:hypothetical protein
MDPPSLRYGDQVDADAPQARRAEVVFELWRTGDELTRMVPANSNSRSFTLIGGSRISREGRGPDFWQGFAKSHFTKYSVLQSNLS